MDPEKYRKILIIGGGYLGERLVNHYREIAEVHVITRSLRKAALWQSLGLKHFALDISNTTFKFNMTGYDLVMLNAAVTVDSPKKNAGQSLYVKGTLNVLRALKRAGFAGKLVMVGSTGMVKAAGKSNMSPGAPAPEVNEDFISEYQPASLTPPYRQFKIWQDEINSCGFTILFLASAGIYGPDRNPGLKVVRGLRVTTQNPDRWINLIHIEDLTRAIITLTEKITRSELFFIADGHPQTLQSLYGVYSKLLKVPQVEFKKPETPDETYFNTGKRISNTKLLSAGVILNHPSFSESMDNILI